MFGRDGVRKKKANHVKKVCGTQLFLEDGCSRSKAPFSTMAFHIVPKVINPKYNKHWKKSAQQSHLGRQKIGWFWAD